MVNIHKMLQVIPFGAGITLQKKMFIGRDMSVPSKFLNKFSEIEFLGRNFKCPNNPKNI